MKVIVSVLILFLAGGFVNFLITRQLKSDHSVTWAELFLILAATAISICFIKIGIKIGIGEENDKSA